MAAARYLVRLSLSSALPALSARDIIFRADELQVPIGQL